HWGANLNIQDEIWLKNNGARLKGQFSRVDYHMDYLRGQLQPHILNDLILSLPTGVRDPYYYDIIGNVSTSNFRASGRRPTLLELKPRYPLLGGWNYTFTLGYDMPLQNWAKYDSSRNTYVLAVPFMTAIPGAAYDDVEVKVILPERASVLEVHPPFPCDEIRRETHVTYLDSVGRPAIIFNKKNVSGKHAEYIYIKYRVSTRAYLQKPIAVATAFVVLFSVAMTLRRIDFKIHSKKQA
ncbi:dolichyl-diphosphooligosaccharide--protein glycosyltransferase subunit 1, partial [Tulasnella sp. 403]